MKRKLFQQLEKCLYRKSFEMRKVILKYSFYYSNGFLLLVAYYFKQWKY